jgi:hypothetical protein
MLHFAGLFVYTEPRRACLLPDPFSGTSYCEEKTLSRSYSHVLLINCETVRSASVRLGTVLNYVSIYKTCSGYSELLSVVVKGRQDNTDS